MKSVTYKRLTFACIVIYAIFMFYVCLQTKALVPDERVFFGIINSEMRYGSLMDVLRTPNYLGYGAIYWIVMKFMRYFLSMRLLSFLLLVSVPICIVLTSRKLGMGDRGILFGIVLYMSCPMSWFTGKIIGPEIMGMAVGAWGGALCISAICKKTEGTRHRSLVLFAAGIMLGVSAGIKLNYAVMFAFVALYIFLQEWLVTLYRKTASAKDVTILFIQYMCLLGFGFLAGILVANPVALTDFDVFMSGYGQVENYSLRYLHDVLWREYIEWDLVNSGGMDNTIISVVAFALLVIASLIYRKNWPLTMAAMLSSLLLIGLCCKGRFLGWYLIPIIYFACLIVPDIKVMPIILAANLIWMWPNTTYQITSKMQQVEMVRHLDEVGGMTDKWESAYPEYDVYYFIEVCVDEYPMFAAYNWDSVESPHRLIFISERAKANGLLGEIYEWGNDGTNGYRLLEEKDGIAAILYEIGT